VVVNLVPVVFGSGRPFFATGALAEPLLLENPTTIVAGDRVTGLRRQPLSSLSQWYAKCSTYATSGWPS
jgi:hypothetical protein